MRHYCNVYQRTILQRTLTEVNVYMRRHQTRSFARSTLVTAEFSETPNPAYFYANFSCCTPKKSFRQFFRTPVFSVSTCIIIVNFSHCSDQRRRLGSKLATVNRKKKSQKRSASRLEVLARMVGVMSTWHCRNSQSEARI